jgi:hypothetical protein
MTFKADDADLHSYRFSVNGYKNRHKIRPHAQLYRTRMNNVLTEASEVSKEALYQLLYQIMRAYTTSSRLQGRAKYTLPAKRARYLVVASNVSGKDVWCH